MFPRQLLCAICPSRGHEDKGASYPASVPPEHHSPDGEDYDGVDTGKGPWPRLLGVERGSNQSRLLESSDATTLSARMSRSSRGKGNILDKKACVYKIQKHHSLVSGGGGFRKLHSK